MLYRTGFSTPVFGLRREIDKLFEDTFGRGEGMNAWTPAVDVRESENELRLELELPGIRPEDVELTADNGVLTIRGEKRSERKEGEEGEEGSRYHVVERSYGSFTRSFQLPAGLDEEKIEADYDNGILSVHIPKTALPQPRKIQIGRQTGQRQMNAGQAQNMGEKNHQQQVTTRSTGSNGGSEGNTSKSTANRSRETAGAR